MPKLIERPLTVAEYEELARAYHKTLPLEHFMESVSQSTQRKITSESLDLVSARRPEVQAYTELLVQYKIAEEIRRVVPDGMVRLSEQPLITESSYNLECF